MNWISSNIERILDLTVSHIWLTLAPTIIGLILALPLGWWAHRSGRGYAAIVGTAGLLYTIPSLALFIILPVILGTKILDPINIVVALTLYTLALLVRVVADGLSSVPHDTVAAAEAMGYRGWQRLVLVELPVAVPVIAAGLRVAVVSNVSIVTMAALLGIPQLGSLFTQGFQLRLYVPARHRCRPVCRARGHLRRLDHLVEQALNPLAAKDGHLVNIFGWFTDPSNWTGSDGIPTQIGYHLLYSAVALLAALAIAVPLGIVIGYTGRGEAVVAGFANALRALPSLGLLVLLFLIISPVVTGKLVYVLPTIIVLVLLAVPPILTGTYAGIQNADPDAVGAARGMGFTKRQILLRVQLPCALPLMISGVRSSTLQIISTATIAAYLGLQGLGRFILDGRAQANFAEMAGGAILVAVLAIVLEFSFAWLGRLIVSPGLRRTAAKSTSPVATTVPAPAAT